MPKFFVSPEDISDEIILKGDNYHHAANVLRLKKGEEITVCDGSGNDYTAVISKISDGEMICGVTDFSKNAGEPEIKITLFQGVPKGDKLSLICEKCVEAGVYEIISVDLTRCVSKITKKDFEKKRERLSKISLSAAKQSKRGRVPRIGELVTLDEMLSVKNGYDLFLFPYELEETTSLKQVIRGFKGKTIALVIGPEGGFSPDEAERITEAGITPVSLGKRILRTETAGMAAIFNILYELENN